MKTKNFVSHKTAPTKKNTKLQKEYATRQTLKAIFGDEFQITNLKGRNQKSEMTVLWYFSLVMLWVAGKAAMKEGVGKFFILPSTKRVADIPHCYGR